ncbi:hypothetical protein FQR65_LT01529 [Abscondita terminalis]|nr:hypothetical protein FQR65_LT01529 [Abscondita terminalis]
MNLHGELSIPKIPSTTPLNIGITTRVMAKRQQMQRQRDEEEGYKYKTETERRRRSSKYMTGAKMPNSVIKMDAYYALNPKKQEQEKREELEEFVDKLINRLKPKSSVTSKNSLQERVTTNNLKALPILIKDSQKVSKENKRSVSISVPKQETSSIGTNVRWQELREKRRITRSSSLSGEKQPTYNSIKKAIDNSKVIQQLLDVDQVEEEKMNQLRSVKSLSSNDSTRSSIFKEDFKIFSSTTIDSAGKKKKKSSTKRKSSTKIKRSSKKSSKKHTLKQNRH